MGLVQVSHLECKKCGVEFDYGWVPLASFTSLRLGKWRYMSCPRCHKLSIFNMADTRVDPHTHHCQLRVGPS